MMGTVVLVVGLAFAFAFSVFEVDASHAETPMVELFNVERAKAREGLEEGPLIRVVGDSSRTLANGDWIEVEWKNLRVDKGETPLIAVYSPASGLDDLTSTSPVKFKMIEGESSEGRFEMRLLNLRDEEGYGIGLFRGSLSSPVLVARVEDPVIFTRPKTEVTQVHISLADESGKLLRISWTTGSAEAQEVVYWDESNWASVRRATPQESVRYSAEDMCGPPATTQGYHDAGYQHSVLIEDLEPGASFGYSVGGVFEGTFSGRPLSRDRVRVAVFGDMGTAQRDGSLDAGHASEKAALLTMKLLEAEALDEGLHLVLHIGDISYARGYAAQWDEFMDQIESIAKSVPWMVASGNHERDAPSGSSSPLRPQLSRYRGFDSGGECGIPYSARFLMPPPALAVADDTPWYAFSFGPVRFVVMSTEHDFYEGSPQHDYLLQQFAGVDREETPWLVLAGHRPMYVDSIGPGADDCVSPTVGPCPNDQPVSRELREALEGAMVEHEVDLALWGHHHSYQRTCPVVDGECVSEEGVNAPVQVVVGMAGYDLTTNTHDLTPGIFEYVNIKDHGVSFIEADGETLTLSFVLDDSMRTKADEVKLFKSPFVPSNEVEMEE